MAEERVARLEARLKKLEDRLEGFRAPEGITDEELETFRKVGEAVGLAPCVPGTCWGGTCWSGTCWAAIGPCRPCGTGTCEKRRTSQPGGTERFSALGKKKK
jgi:hypothetical protein